MLVSIIKSEKAPKVDPMSFLDVREDGTNVFTLPAVGMGNTRTFVLDDKCQPATVEDARALAQAVINRRSSWDGKGLKRLAVKWASATRFTFQVVIPTGEGLGVKTVTTLPGVMLRITGRSFVTAD